MASVRVQWQKVFEGRFLTLKDKLSRIMLVEQKFLPWKLVWLPLGFLETCLFMTILISGQKSLQYFCCCVGQNDDTKNAFCVNESLSNSNWNLKVLPRSSFQIFIWDWNLSNFLDYVSLFLGSKWCRWYLMPISDWQHKLVLEDDAYSLYTNYCLPKQELFATDSGAKTTEVEGQ